MYIQNELDRMYSNTLSGLNELSIENVLMRRFDGEKLEIGKIIKLFDR